MPSPKFKPTGRGGDQNASLLAVARAETPRAKAKVQPNATPVVRPMLFSTPMVRAELDDAKTQTRRTRGLDFEDPDRPILHRLKVRDGHTIAVFGDSIPDDPVPLEIVCPYGQPGDRLWGRETWGYRGSSYGPGNPRHKVVDIEYRADGARREFKRPKNSDEGIPRQRAPDFTEDQIAMGKRAEWLRAWWRQWRPSIFMPRWASRLDLEITAIRVERLNTITPADALAEGLTVGGSPDEPVYGWDGAPRWFSDPRDAYRLGWESINGAGSWAANPWVWVVEHRRLRS